MKTCTTTTKTGVALNQVTGSKDWFLVEYDDGTASIHSSWDEAYSAGNFSEGNEAQ